jgi:hypothetical protein
MPSSKIPRNKVSSSQGLGRLQTKVGRSEMSGLALATDFAI